MLFNMFLSLFVMFAGFDNCETLLTLIGIMVMLENTAKAYFFLLRVRAVYGNSMRVRLTIISGWIIVVSRAHATETTDIIKLTRKYLARSVRRCQWRQQYTPLYVNQLYHTSRIV